LIIAAARPFLAGIGAAVLADFFNLQALEQPPSVLVFVVAESLRLTIMALQMQSIREKRRDQTVPLQGCRFRG
jgi:hypothetical protein